VFFVRQDEFLGAFAQLRETPVSFVMSACVSAAPTGQISVKFDTWVPH
jgi:hypothetical protein